MTTTDILTDTERAVICGCGEPARGGVPAAGNVPVHFCRQCADHCQMAAFVGANR